MNTKRTVKVKAEEITPIQFVGCAKLTDIGDISRQGILINFNGMLFGFQPGELKGPKHLADAIYSTILQIEQEGAKTGNGSEPTASPAGEKPVREPSGAEARKRSR